MIGTIPAGLLAAVPAFAQEAQPRETYWRHGWGGGWEHAVSGPLMMLFFWGGLILIIFLAVRWIGPNAGHPKPSSAPIDNPLETLKQRFARGEIDQQEFDERRNALLD